MKVTPFLSARLLLMLSLTIPGAFLSGVSGAVALPTAQLESVTLSEQNQPFIQPSLRRDTLGDLNKAPLGNVIRANDGGTGKESSEKPPKEVCESGNCNGILNPINPRILPTNNISVPQQLQNTRSKSLIQSQKPIF